jgi:hypothetical protein
VSDPKETEGSPRPAWLDPRLVRFWTRHRGWVIPLAVTLVPLLWLARGWPGYIYGQDSQGFVRLFGFNQDPLFPYSYAFEQGYPIPFFVSSFYTASAGYLLGGLTGSPALTERLLLFAYAGIGAVGMWDLLRLVGRRWFGADAGGPVRRGLVLAFYLVNPFTLTVVWWHVEGWTENYVFLPWLLGALLLVYWDGKLSFRRGALVVALSLFLADGVGGAFGVPIGYLFLLFMVALGVEAVRDPARRPALPRAIGSLVALGLAMLSWTSIPFLLTPNPGYGSTTYVTPQNLDSVFVSESKYTVPFNTVRMLGFSWIYGAPNAYPWASAFVVLGVVGTLGAFAYLAAAVWIRRYPGFGLLYVGTGLLLLLSFGSNPPLGDVDRFLLNRGGPFLLLVNPYYLLLEPWVLVVCLSMFVWLASPPRAAVEQLRRLRGWLMAPWGAPAAPTRADEPHPVSRGGNRAEYERPIRLVILALGAVLVVSCLAPVAEFGEYQTAGPNVDEFPLPSGLPQLASYFAHGYAGSEYEVIALPMSRTVAIPWDTPDGSFLDTAGLLESYVPYPVLQQNDGLLPEALMDWFANTPSNNYTEVLEALHVRAVVVNPYVDRNSTLTSTGPDGGLENWTHVESVLTSSLGAPVDVGGFQVYNVRSPTPYLWIETNLTTVAAPTVAGYLALLANVSASDPLGHYLDTALWTPSPVPEPDQLVVTPVTLPSTGVVVPPGGTTRVLLDNGSSLPVPSHAATALGVNWTPTGAGGSEVVSAERQLASLAAGDNVTDLSTGPGGLVGPVGANGSVALDGTFPAPLRVTANVTLAAEPGNDWATFYLRGPNLTLFVQLYENTETGTANLGLAATNAMDQPFAWTNAPIRWGNGSQAFQLDVRDTGDSLEATLVEPGAPGSINETLLYRGAANLTLDQGQNLSAAPTGPWVDVPRSVSLSTTYPGIDLTSFDVYDATPVLGLAVFSGVNRSTALPSTLDQGITGDWTVTVGGGPNGSAGVSPRFLVLDLPKFYAWTVAGGPGPDQSVVVSNESNAFSLGDGGATTLTLSFSSPQLAGLVTSFVELAAIPVLLVVFRLRARNR